ncbi:MAG: hypothetical protein E6Q85_06480 [Thiothrix sp.]|nr:MAG: hypothetical protein E6Q85_06480 [Thiothrix sp.]
MDNNVLKECSCKNTPKIKLFLATKTWPRQCKECNGYIYIEAHLVDAYINSGMALIPAALVLFALYKGLGLLILLMIPIVFRLVELYLFKVHFISEEEKRAREQRKPPGIGTLIVLLFILLVILIYNYKY